MAINQHTLDRAEYTNVFVITKDGALEQQPFQFVNCDGEQWITTLPVLSRLPANPAFARKVVGQTFLPSKQEMAFPLDSAQPAPGSDTKPGIFHVHNFRGVGV